MHLTRYIMPILLGWVFLFFNNSCFSAQSKQLNDLVGIIVKNDEHTLERVITMADKILKGKVYTIEHQDLKLLMSGISRVRTKKIQGLAVSILHIAIVSRYGYAAGFHRYKLTKCIFNDTLANVVFYLRKVGRRLSKVSIGSIYLHTFMPWLKDGLMSLSEYLMPSKELVVYGGVEEYYEDQSTDPSYYSAQDVLKNTLYYSAMLNIFFLLPLGYVSYNHKEERMQLANIYKVFISPLKKVGAADVHGEITRDFSDLTDEFRSSFGSEKTKLDIHKVVSLAKQYEDKAG